ncbi:MAG: hypothetical protein A3C27_02365 [Candidatus Levybacteria bacterium RIFCSPHIGHO2_02_FULL_39_36]|nr:MAG: hypothetical protein A3C27_02365 [Candidatus Levybacteria bacterium RIFCSPHIGHO2_02_FULL_39_36]
MYLMIRSIFIILMVGTILAVTFILWATKSILKSNNKPSIPSPSVSISTQNQKTEIVAQNLEVPWAIAFLSDGSMLVTERAGRIRHIEDGKITNTFTIEQVLEIGEGGLQGITLHPYFESNKYLYVYYTYRSEGNNTFNRVARYKLESKSLVDEKIIVDRIPGASNHDGGRIKFGPDGLLYIGTGDAQNPSQAQDTKTLGGKILRVNDDGKIPADNPFGNAVYSYGHRNVQGLAWDSSGNLWSTEHGRSGVASGYDEINLIEKGKNYGWADIEGAETQTGIESPKRQSGATTTWAPAGAAFINNSFFFGGLRGQTLYEAIIDGGKVTDFKEHFKGEYGRIREVILGPDNFLYITTSNRDGRGLPQNNDDKIMRINIDKL